MKVTVCQLNDDPNLFEQDWQALAQHVSEQASQLVLLPEMPFSAWFARQPGFDPAVWGNAIAVHDTWMARLAELAPALVLGSRPVERQGRRLNEGFSWQAEAGYQAVHHKYYLPDEDRFWEASWYQRGEDDFIPLDVAMPDESKLSVGMLICTELWFMQRARVYGQQGIHILANPRATEGSTVEKWLVGGRAAAVISGAYCLSSNRVDPHGDPLEMGGLGWVVAPDGQVLGRTSSAQPFVTVEIDLAQANAAKSTYPRYVLD
jgi:N-carbamoylputrescine amidase